MLVEEAREGAVKRCATDFPLCNDRLTVLEFEGTVQLILYQDGWPGGPKKVIGNLFCDPGTANELEQIAAHIRQLCPAVSDAAPIEVSA